MRVGKGFKVYVSNWSSQVQTWLHKKAGHLHKGTHTHFLLEHNSRYTLAHTLSVVLISRGCRSRPPPIAELQGWPTPSLSYSPLAPLPLLILTFFLLFFHICHAQIFSAHSPVLLYSLLALFVPSMSFLSPVSSLSCLFSCPSHPCTRSSSSSNPSSNVLSLYTIIMASMFFLLFQLQFTLLTWNIS